MENSELQRGEFLPTTTSGRLFQPFDETKLVRNTRIDTGIRLRNVKIYQGKGENIHQCIQPLY